MQKNKTLNLIVDTNLWISFIISHTLDKLDSFLLTQKAKLLFSIELIEEIRTTAAKPKLRKYLGAHVLEEMFENLDAFIILINVHSKVTICRDLKDNFLLALAKDGNADYLITGDKDFLPASVCPPLWLYQLIE